MIQSHLSYQIYLPLLEQNYCTPPKCGKLSEYTDSVHTEVEDPSSRCINESDEYERCRHDTNSFILPAGARCSSVVREFAHGAMGRRIDPPLSYFSFQPVLHDWCNKGRGMCYPVCGMVHIKESLLLIEKSSPCVRQRVSSLAIWMVLNHMSDAI